MNLLYDYQAFDMQTYGGVSRSFIELINGLNARGNSCKIGIKESSNVYLPLSDVVGDDIRPREYRYNKWFGHEQYFHGEDRLKRAIFKIVGYDLNPNRGYCINLLKHGKFDVFHPTFYDDYFLDYLKDKPFVLTVHDMMPELFPEYFDCSDFQIIQKRKLCPLAAHIHVPSQRTKSDLINILNVEPDKISVIPHGYRAETKVTPIKDEYICHPYILYVGARYAYKNFISFVHECARVMKDIPDLKVLCTGYDFENEELQLFAALGVENRFRHLFVNDEELNYLYRNAVCFVFPSLYEGFGLPILEAYANNCPVMLNNTSCFPEIAGDAAIYFEMEKSGKSDFYEKFSYLYKLSSEDRQKLIDAGIKRLSMYSWSKASEQLEMVYQRCN